MTVVLVALIAVFALLAAAASAVTLHYVRQLPVPETVPQAPTPAPDPTFRADGRLVDSPEAVLSLSDEELMRRVQEIRLLSSRTLVTGAWRWATLIWPDESPNDHRDLALEVFSPLKYLGDPTIAHRALLCAPFFSRRGLP